MLINVFIFSTRSQCRARSDELMTSNQKQMGTPEVPKEIGNEKEKKTRARVVFSSFSDRTRTADHRRMEGYQKKKAPMQDTDLNRQALIVKRKMAARYFRFSSCFEFIISSNLSHVGPCCVMGHFRLSFHGRAFDDTWSFRSCSFKASRRKNVQIVAPFKTNM